MQKKSILIITPFIPFPLNSGGRIAQYKVNKHLQEVFDITMTFTLRIDQHNELDQLKRQLSKINFAPFIYNGPIKERNIKLILQRFSEFYLRTLGHIYFNLRKKDRFDALIMKFTTLFKSRSRAFPIQFIDHINALILNNNYDYVQVEFHQLLYIVKYLPEGVKKIFIDHELRYIREKRELNLLNFRSNFLNNIYLENKRFETQHLELYDIICTLSENDKEQLSHLLRFPKIYSSPIPIKLKVKNNLFNFDNKIVFLGGEDHFPNKEGLEWFISNCWVSLKEKYPALVLTIIGKWNFKTIDFYSEQYDGIEFKGFVDDLPSALNNSIFIVPVRIGSGIRIKILDAVSTGIPFITTTIGVEGLGFRHERECLIADTSSEFSQMIQRVIETPHLGTTLSNNALAILKKDYSYEKLLKKRENLYFS